MKRLSDELKEHTERGLIFQMLPEYEGHNWYVKFMVDEENFLESISFHPCEKDMRLANGILLKKSIDEEDKPHWRREVK